MEVKDIFKNLEKFNLSVENVSDFLNFINTYSDGYDGFFNEIKGFQLQLSKTFNYEEYEMTVIDYLKRIQSFVSKDSFFVSVDENSVSEYKLLIKKIINKNVILYKIKQSKTLITVKEKQLKDIDDSIELLNKKELDDIQKTIEASKLVGNRARILKEYRDAKNVIDHEEDYIKNLESRDKIILRDELLHDFQTLFDCINKLNLSDDTRSNLNDIFLDIKDFYIKYNFDANKVREEYQIFLSNAGLKDKLDSDLDKERIAKEFNDNSDNIISENDSLNNEVNDTDKSMEDEKSYEGLVDLKDVLVPGTYLVYNGSKPLSGKNNTVNLIKGCIYKLSRIDKSIDGNDVIYLDGFDVGFSPLFFDLEDEWNDKIDGFKVLDKYEFNKEDKYKIYLNSFSGLISLTKISESVLSVIKNVISRIGKLDSKDNEDDGLIDKEEFAQEYERIRDLINLDDTYGDKDINVNDDSTLGHKKI